MAGPAAGIWACAWHLQAWQWGLLAVALLRIWAFAMQSFWGLFGFFLFILACVRGCWRLVNTDMSTGICSLDVPKPSKRRKD